MLDRPVPLYVQIARILRRELADGVYPIASRMPDELSLASRFGVSKDVIRVSMRLLAQEKLVKPIRSRGTFVCEQNASVGSSYVLLSYHGALHQAEICNGIVQAMPARSNLVLKRNVLFDLENERRILESINYKDVRALIAAPIYSGMEDNSCLYARILNSGVPVLIIDHSLPNIQADEISFDEYGATVRLFREAMKRIGDKPAVMFVDESEWDRLGTIRYKAMLDVWKEFGGSSETHKLCCGKFKSSDNLQEIATSMLKMLGKVEYENYAMLTCSVLHSWEICRILRARGEEQRVCMYAGIGDIYRGDEEFNSKVYSHYRLFDEFTPLISDVLKQRFSGEHAPSIPIRKSVGFLEMTGEQMRQYIQDKHAEFSAELS